MFCGSEVADVENEVCDGDERDAIWEGLLDDDDVDDAANVVARVASKFPSPH